MSDSPPSDPDTPAAPRFSSRMRRQGLFKPQHRVVLFLLAASSGAYMLTILFPPKDKAEQADRTAAAPRAPAPPLEFPRQRGALVPLPAPDAPLVPPVDEGDLVLAGQALAPALSACAEEHASALAPLDGRLAVRADVGPDGLMQAVLVDVAEADPSAVRCFATAAWSLAWPRRSPPETVLVPFYVVAPLSAAEPAPSP